MIRSKLAVIAAFLILAASALGGPIHEAVTVGDIGLAKSLIESEPSLLTAPDSTGSQPIHLAAQHGHKAMLEMLLGLGADINSGDREGTTPIGVAGLFGQLEMARFIIDKGADLTVRDIAGMTPFHFAVQGGNVDIVNLLIEKGADINELNGRGSNALHLASFSGNIDLVKFFLDKGMDINSQNNNGYTSMYFAAFRGHVDLIDFLAENGADIEKPDNNGITPLAGSGYTNKLEAAQKLIALGANVNTEPNQHGHTPIIAAVWGRNPQIVQLFLDNGASIESTNPEGETLMHFAAMRGATEVAQFLVDKGMDVNIVDNHDVTPIANAAHNQPEMVQWLIDHGASVNPVNDSSVVPLTWSIYGGDTTTVRTLINGGADVNWCRRNDASTINIAIRNGKLDITRILVDAGADLGLADEKTGRNPLHTAALLGKLPMVELLVSAGADLNSKDTQGHTAYYYANKYCYTNVADYLVAQGASTAGVKKRNGAPPILAKAPATGEAEVCYLGHSGWAIRTANHFMIFDYWEPEYKPDMQCLANGYVVPDELKDLKVTVFSSHEHGDHYDTTIFGWRDQLTNVSYVLGHQPADQQNYTYIEPRTTQVVDGMTVSTITSTDAGVGYIIEVDGLTIFHAGDHSSGTVEPHAEYIAEIDWVAEKWPQPDIAFMPISGCSLGTPESVKAGVYYALDKLQPNIYVPQHMSNNEYRYKEFETEARQNGYKTKMLCAEHRGDTFHVTQKGTI